MLMSSILTTKVLLFLVSEHKVDSLHNVFSLSVDVQSAIKTNTLWIIR